MSDLLICDFNERSLDMLRNRAARAGRRVEEEARLLLEEALSLKGSPWDELYALADHWVRQDLGEDKFDTTAMIRADRDGMRDCDEFEALVARIRLGDQAGEAFRPTHG